VKSRKSAEKACDWSEKKCENKKLINLTCQKEIPSRSAEKHFFREGVIFLKKAFNNRLTAFKKCLKSV